MLPVSEPPVGRRIDMPPGWTEGWQPSARMFAEILDDPDTGTLILDRLLRPVLITSEARRCLGLSPEIRIDHLDLYHLLSLTELDTVSAASAETCILSTLYSEPTLLRTCGAIPRALRLKVRSVTDDYRLASFRKVIETPQERASLTGPVDVLDGLTGLASRKSFEHAVRTALTKSLSQRFVVILLDLDRFKPINDTLGHTAGDKVLRLVAERIRSAVRAADLVARLGGDEFAVLVSASSANEAAGLVGRILEIVQRTYLVEGHLVNVGASLGVAVAPDDGTTCEDLMRRADLALYRSKSSGRATFHFFEPYMEAKAQVRRENELELRRALALRQLEVHYQPQVDTNTGCLVGFEALVRWRHPVRGLIPPNDFLPLAEEIGIINALGEFVLRTACRQAMNWDDSVVIAVNASPLQFETGGFADTVRSVLESTGLPGKRLEIEVTEGILLRNEENVLTTLYRLRDMNVKIAMDDFGTGYASLSQLANFPFDKIKIDKSLSGAGGHNPKHRAIVRAIAAMGGNLGVCTMAEGVENAEQLERLQTDGCDAVQGYLFSRPVPASELKSLIDELKMSSERRESNERGNV